MKKVIESYLQKLQEYDEMPNLVGYCIRTYEGNPMLQIKCLRTLRGLVLNTQYQNIIDRYVDSITNTYEPTCEPGDVGKQ